MIYQTGVTDPDMPSLETKRKTAFLDFLSRKDKFAAGKRSTSQYQNRQAQKGGGFFYAHSKFRQATFFTRQ